MRYKRLEHTADVMIKAFGSSMSECFSNAAYGMMDTILDASSITVSKTVSFSIVGDNLDELLYNFLAEILYYFDADHFAPVEFEINIDSSELSCVAGGEKYDPNKHNPKAEVKAITYHGMDVNIKEPSITVLFDV